jgi:hypothetical protein
MISHLPPIFNSFWRRLSLIGDVLMNGLVCTEPQTYAYTAHNFKRVRER